MERRGEYVWRDNFLRRGAAVSLCETATKSCHMRQLVLFCILLFYMYAQGGEAMASLAGKRLFLLDMDGTLYLDDRLFPKVPEFLSLIRRRGGRYLFLTNNSSRGVEGYREKLGRMGIATELSDYMTSADAAEHTLLTEFAGRKCYVSGTASLKRQLKEAGVDVTDVLSDDIDLLLSGFDTELTFQKLEDSCILLNRGVTWLATNPDWVCPTWYGSVPDCGSVCEMLHRATGKTPRFLGKPQP